MMPQKGDEVVVLVEGQKLKGKIIGDQGGMLIITDGSYTMFATKTKIGAIMIAGTDPDTAKADEARPESVADQFMVMACSNLKVGCKGVCYVKHGQGASRNDFESFMAKCAKRQPSCMAKSLGKLSNTPPTILKEMLDNTVFGEYPEADQ
jgi:hypothetical protein